MSDPVETPIEDVAPPDTPKDAASGYRHMLRLVGRFQPDWKPYVLAGATAAGTTLCEAGTLILLTMSATSIAGDEADQTIASRTLSQTQMLAVAGGLLLVRLVLTWSNAQLISRTASRTMFEARRQVLAAYVDADWEVQSRQQQGIMYDLLANRSDVVGLSTVVLSNTVVAVINIAVLAVAALVLQPLAVLALVVIGGVIGLVLRPLNRHTRTLAHQYLDANEVFINSITDLTHNARDLTAYGVGERFRARVVEQQTHAVDIFRRRLRLLNFTPQAYQTIGLGLAVAGLAVAAAVGGDDVGTLAAVILLLLRGITYGQMLVNASQNLSERLPLVASLVAALDRFAEVRVEPGTQVPTSQLDLRLTGVRYRYGTDEVLRGVDLQIPPGERLGVVGPSGGGKSTLLQILAGLRTPCEGAYLVGGIPIGQIDPSWWATRMALVSQDARLLTGSVHLNIGIYRDLPHDAIVRGATGAQLADEVAALGGYDVELSREGRGLSGGQLQRLAIARALAGEPDILLLDEPTSALDVATEARLQEVLTQLHGRTTMVIVAHRLATVAGCDRIIVVERGEIIAQGPPEVVLDRFGSQALEAWELVEGEEDEAAPTEP
ncbi:MAG: ATP-binding cassette domain-containing protein [Acidimicrobiales bacterium]|nr:ATP-binding cassette domain-containing protein [Acidimicrobiales bacterium]